MRTVVGSDIILTIGIMLLTFVCLLFKLFPGENEAFYLLGAMGALLVFGSSMLSNRSSTMSAKLRRVRKLRKTSEPQSSDHNSREVRES